MWHKASEIVVIMSDKLNNEKLFGVIAVERGLITRGQLYEALKTQVDDDLDWGDHRYLGEVLHQQGAMTQEQIDEVLQTLGVLEQIFDEYK